VTIGASTIEKWHHAYKKGGFDALFPQSRKDELWYGDTMYGPWLKEAEGKKRVYFIALIDDASRFISAWTLA